MGSESGGIGGAVVPMYLHNLAPLIAYLQTDNRLSSSSRIQNILKEHTTSQEQMKNWVGRAHEHLVKKREGGGVVHEKLIPLTPNVGQPKLIPALIAEMARDICEGMKAKKSASDDEKKKEFDSSEPTLP